MACELTTGFDLDCKDGIGGIKEIFLAAHTEVQTNVTIASNVITALGTMTLYRINLPRGTGSYTENITADPAAGTGFWAQELQVTLHKISTAKNAEITLWLKQRLCIFIRDQNDNVRLMGRQDACHVTGGTSVTGTAKGDLNGYTLTFTAEEKLPAELLTAFTSVPFDNFADVTVSPAYPTPET